MAGIIESDFIAVKSSKKQRKKKERMDQYKEFILDEIKKVIYWFNAEFLLTIFIFT